MIIHKLTPAQLKLVTKLNKRVQKAKKPLGEFLQYLIEEAQLPATEQGYSFDSSMTSIISVDPELLPKGNK